MRSSLSTLVVLVALSTVTSAAPTAPTSFRASVSGQSVSLAWDPSFGTVLTYRLEAGSRSGASDVGVFDVGTATSVVVQAPPGTYFARVRAVGPDGVSPPSNEITIVVTGGTAPPPPSTCDSVPIALGQTVSATLAGNDCMPGQRPQATDLYVADLQAGTGVVVTMNAGTMTDPYLFLADPNMQVVAQDDDSGDGLNARITYTVLATGRYTIAATAYSASDRGTYTLSIVRDGAAPPTPTPTPTPGGCASVTITIGQTVNGEISAADCSPAQRPQLSDVYAVDLTGGTRVVITMRRGTLNDPYLTLLNSTGQVVVRDDDSAGDRNALITYAVPGTGRYTILASAYSVTDRGTYTLTVVREGATPTPTPTPPRTNPCSASFPCYNGRWNGQDICCPAAFPVYCVYTDLCYRNISDAFQASYGRCSSARVEGCSFRDDGMPFERWLDAERAMLGKGPIASAGCWSAPPAGGVANPFEVGPPQ